MTATEKLSLRELNEKIAAKQRQVREILDGSKADGEYKLTSDQVSDLRQRNDELKELGERRDELVDIEEMRKALPEEGEQKGAKAGGGRREMVPGGDGGTKSAEPEVRSLKGMLDESKSYQAFRAGAVKSAEIDLTEAELKTLLTLTNIAPQAQRSPNVVPYAEAFRAVSDLFAQGTLDGNTLEYYAMTTRTNAAAEVAEGAAKPESAIDFTLTSETLRKIATWLPATEESLMDTPALMSMIKEVLADLVVRRREAQLLNGNGTAPNLKGILQRSGIQTQAKGTDPVFDAILKAMTLIRVTGDAEPTGIIMHPNDWQDLVLTRTADGIYILGNPSDPQVGSRLWGLDVRATPQETENTALVGAFRPYAQIFRKPNSAMTIKVSTEHSTFFVENKVAVLAEERLLLAVYREAAFAKVTGI